MTEGIQFPDVEAEVITELKAATSLTSLLAAGWTVSTKIPNTLPTEFVTVRRTGGPKETLVSEAAQITVEAWALKEARAITILSVCRAIINASDGLLFGVRELGGPINLPDPNLTEDGYTRYTMTFMVRARGSVITV